MQSTCPPRARATRREVFVAFLRLGLTSFGGPIAHLGYFRQEFVERRRWLDEAAYADLVALCQFLPGPASSEVGIGIGLSRAGLCRRARGLDRLHPALGDRAGAVRPGRRASRLRSTRPGCTGSRSRPSRWWRRRCGAWRSTLADRQARATLAVAAAALVLAVPTTAGQLGAIALGALAGIIAAANATAPPVPACHGAAIGRGAIALPRGVLRAAARAAAAASAASRARRWRCSTPSIAPARWCSAAAMWCCRCCRPRWCRRAG